MYTPTQHTAAALARAAASDATDFTNDIAGVNTYAAMNILAARAIVIVTDDEPAQSLSVPREAIRLLAARGWELLDERTRDEAAALADAIQAGDVDRRGWVIPYPQYQGV